MSAKQLLDLALYIVLLIPALVFVHSYVLEYLGGKTFFVQTSIPIRFEDVPAITICFGYNYEQVQSLTRNFEYKESIRNLSPELLAKFLINVLLL